MDLAVWIMFGLASAVIGVIVISVPMRARILELRDERNAWRARAHAAEGYRGDPDLDDVRIVPQPPREHGLDVFYGEMAQEQDRAKRQNEGLDV